MLEACARGHEVGWCTPADLWVQEGVATARITWGTVSRAQPAFVATDVRAEALAAADVIWMRKDPPFHMGYLLATYILAMVPAPTVIVNAPAGLQRFNEKLWAMHFLFEGEPVAGVLRVPSEGDHRANLHVGGRAVATALTEREQQICDRLRPHLSAHGQVFVGIDVIGGYLTEINVTSPTDLQDATRLYGVRLEVDLIDRLERRVAAARA